jgi:hypothetical protein
MNILFGFQYVGTIVAPARIHQNMKKYADMALASWDAKDRHSNKFSSFYLVQKFT